MLRQPLTNASKFLFRNRIRVLLYHRVNNYSNRLAVHPLIFEKQIQYLKKEYNIITLTQYKDILETGSHLKNPVLITFDDGYRDNYTDAYPILTKYSVPATIFLTTDFVDGKSWMWLDMLRYIVNNAPLKPKSLILNDCEYTLNISHKNEIFKVRRAFFNHLKEIPYAKRIQQLKTLASSLVVTLPERPPEQYAPLSWEHVREMSNNNIEFGAHTCTHEILSKMEIEHAYNEVINCKNRIETELQSEVDTFAYPNGQPDDFTEQTKILLKTCGYRLAFTTINGMNTRFTDRLLNNRISGPAESDEYFFSNISGLNIIKHKVKEFFQKS